MKQTKTLIIKNKKIPQQNLYQNRVCPFFMQAALYSSKYEKWLKFLPSQSVQWIFLIALIVGIILKININI